MTELDSKCARGINGQLLKTLGADVLLSRKKLRKTLGGVKKAYQTYFFGKKKNNSSTAGQSSLLRCRGVERAYESGKSSLEQSMSAGYHIK